MNDSHYTEADKKRLRPSEAKIVAEMVDGQFYTLDILAIVLKMRPGTIASRLRDIKASGFWSYERKRDKDVQGLHWYRLYKVEPGQMPLFESQDAASL
jgi:hypothetical protein